MAVLFFLLWIIFNGRVTLEIVLFGIAISALLTLFICKVFGYSRKTNGSLQIFPSFFSTAST